MLKLFKAIIFFSTCCLIGHSIQAQHSIAINATLDDKEHRLTIDQTLTYFNQSKDTLSQLFINDWSHSFSSNKTNLAQRFSDEFTTNFYLSLKGQKGHTDIDSLSKNILKWHRLFDKTDVIVVYLNQPLAPNEQTTIRFHYKIKIPDDKFTGYGYNSNGYYLKEWFLFPFRYDTKTGFDAYSNLGLDDASNPATNYSIVFTCSSEFKLHSELHLKATSSYNNRTTYELEGSQRLNAKVVLEKENTFDTFTNNAVEIQTNIKENRLDLEAKKTAINKIHDFVNQNIGPYPHKKIIVSNLDYNRNPLYGLSQLPSFINPFSDDFQYEIKFLKTYLNQFLQNTLQVNLRKDDWLLDGIQMYYIQKYIETHYPDTKLLGDLSKLGLLKRYYLTQIPFNNQSQLLYLYMARKNQDQAVGLPKDEQIRFNDKITGKYKSGINFHYLNNYLSDHTVDKSFQDYYLKNLHQPTNQSDFRKIIESNTSVDINWFFENLVYTRNSIDYSIDDVKHTTNDSITFTITNRANHTVPIPLYGIKNDSIIFKKWYPKIVTDSTFTIARENADYLILNYNNEVVEYNRRNNYKNTLKGNHRPYKFVFFTDIEEPSRKQIFYVPTGDYNLYNGIFLGMKFDNKSLILKNTELSVNPYYSQKSNALVGSLSLSHNFNFRDQRLFLIRYFISGSQFDYAADAKYTKLNTTLNFMFRNPDLRDNFRESIHARYILINRETSLLVTDEKQVDYGIFNLNYSRSRQELLHHKGISFDLQMAKNFGKTTAEFNYKYLFRTNQQFYIRLFAGTFLYRNNLTDNYFDFALDRPTDYLFQYNYYGRSESTGIYSQQIIIAEGGFKSKLTTPFANEWLTTVNLGFTVYNWFELYGDAGFVKNKRFNTQFLYDSGIKLNLVPSFFELYLPVNSSNGWEISQPNYAEKIRFVITLSPNTLLRLYTRKWF